MEAVANRAAIGEVDGRLVGDGRRGSRLRDVGATRRGASRMSRRRAACRVVEAALEAGTARATGRARADRADLPCRCVTFASRRSRSRMAPSVLRSSVRSMVCCEQLARQRRAAPRSRASRMRRTQQALAQQAAAHAGAGLVENVEQRRVACVSPANSGSSSSRLRTVTASRTMRVGAIVEAGPVQVIERGALRVAQVMQDRAGAPPTASGLPPRPQPSRHSSRK